MFCASSAGAFNDFIHRVGLSEFNMKFTCVSKDGSKLSKLDRFLVCDGFKVKWPEANVTVLPRRCSDHRPILLKTMACDYGPRPFRCFNSWLDRPGFSETVIKAYREAVVQGPPDLRFLNRMKSVKKAIKEWRSIFKDKVADSIEQLYDKINFLELQAESRILSDEEKRNRGFWIKEVMEIENIKEKDCMQKARVKWVVDGDELFPCNS